MKNVFKVIGIIGVVSCMITACATQEQTTEKADVNTAVSAPVPPKPGPFSNAMNAYYQLKDAFVRTDGTSADMMALQFRLSVDSMDAKKLKVDSSLTGTITGYKKNILASVDSLIKQRDMQQKRRQFQTISDALYSLVRAVPYQGETIYQLHCPMAFDTGANWLNNLPVVNNPYFGSKMEECGEVVDSLQGK